MNDSYWKSIGRQLLHHRLGVGALCIIVLFTLVGIYAPFLASSKPLFVLYDHTPYFPLFRYLFYSGFYTKGIDLFFNLMMVTLPAGFGIFFLFKKHPWIYRVLLVGLFFIQLIGPFYLILRMPHDPASSASLNIERQEALEHEKKERGAIYPSWNFDLAYMTPYAKLNLLLRERQRKERSLYLQQYAENENEKFVSQWEVEQQQAQERLERAEVIIRREEVAGNMNSVSYRMAKAERQYIQDKQTWINAQEEHLQFIVMPLLRSYHWEDDAGGQRRLHQQMPWWEVTRTNHKDFAAALIFGVRISLMVGIASVALALIIGIPIGAISGYYAGMTDVVICRVLEIWEAMPTFFMLLTVVAILQSKSLFLIISVIGLFGWTSFSRYIRGEFLKQRSMPYVEACDAQGFRDSKIIFSHILPNALPPLLTLLPFAIMGAITSEAGLSFLGLGEEGSSSWGVLMDEGRQAFPGETALLWPPAILLTILLVAFAIVGDALRDVLDPKLKI